VNAWARHHAQQLERDLAAGETLLGANRVVLVSASSIATWPGPMVDPGPAGRTDAPLATRRLAPHRLKLSTARRLGFPLPGWIFVLGVSDRRLLLWRATPLLASPHEFASSVAFEDIAAVRALRRLGPTRMSIVLDRGSMLVVQALWSRQLATLAAAFEHARTTR
jgi:hypothetical protein